MTPVMHVLRLAGHQECLSCVRRRLLALSLRKEGWRSNSSRTLTTTLTPYSSGRSSLKSHTCGELRPHHEREKVTLRGHLQYQRLGKFAILRDAFGKTQVLIKEEDTGLQKKLTETTFESYVEVTGTVFLRPQDQINENISSGKVEVVADSFQVLSQAREDLPFLIREHNKPKEQLRLKYRYLDLRHSELQTNLRLKSQVSKKMRDYLQDKEGFVEITTPTLSVNTPGGAQEFVVPSRHPGKFYSLVQSPQVYKQLSMIGGFDRYFQFAVCYRDEGAKPDRQPEFLQLDIEMSDVTMKDIQQLVEDLIHYSWPPHLPPLSPSFPTMTYTEAVTSYGSDKPDTRFDWKLQNVTQLFKNCGAPVLENAVSKPESSAYSFVIPQGQAHINKKVVSSWEELAQKEYSQAGVSVFRVESDSKLKGPNTRKISPDTQGKLCKTLEAHMGDLIVLAIGETDCTLGLLGRLRLLSAKTLEMAGVRVRDLNSFNFLWVVDFPLFETDPRTGRTVSVHHPFTQPREEDMHYLHTDPLKVRSQHYDLVLNGCEIGGGSIRIHNSAMQRYILYEILKIGETSLQFLHEALDSGAPPHGGIALGFDRFIAELCGAHSIRDVIAFPKSLEGHCLMSGAPGEITEEEKELYNISTKQN